MRRSVTILAVLVSRQIQITVTHRAWLGWLMLATVAEPMVALTVWYGAAQLGAPLPVPLDYLVTYFVLIAVVGMLTSSWSAYFLAQSIRLGDLARWLVRPCSTHLSHLANNLGEKIAKLVILLPFCVVVALLTREWFTLPSAPVRWLALVPALLMASMINFAIDVAIGSLAFWFDEVSGFLRVRMVLAHVLSGAVVPLALMPDVLAPVLDVQPFRFVVSFPLEVLIGPEERIAPGLGIQAFWLVAAAGGALLLWRRGLRTYQAAGA